jgi:NAD(P)H-hydrate epimerase
LEPTETGTISQRAFEYGRIDAILKGKDLLALGPGLGTHQDTFQFVLRLMNHTNQPMVIDADGLNAFSGHAEKLRGKDRLLVFTPHPGEFARLVGISNQAVLENRIELARSFALDHQVHLILKGHRTLYATPAGQIYINSTGNPGMATGGTGDVLGGFIASQVVQEKDFLGAILSAVFVHGLAGDIAAEKLGERSVTAGDLIRYLPPALKALAEEGAG